MILSNSFVNIHALHARSVTGKLVATDQWGLETIKLAVGGDVPAVVSFGLPAFLKFFRKGALLKKD